MTTITEVMADVQAKLKAPKGQTNTFGKYKYRSCEDIVEAVKPLLSEHGAFLNITDEIELIGERYYVKASASVFLGDNVGCTAIGWAREPAEKKGMDLAQLTGATSSYARKYALNGLFAIDDTRDADTQDNRKEGKAQISPEPINAARVAESAAFFRKTIDDDCIEETHEAVKNTFRRLTPDEKMEVGGKLDDCIEGSKKKYKTVLREYIEFKGNVDGST